MTFLIINGVDITHSRLVDLTKLADQSKTFYDWVEVQFQTALSKSETLIELVPRYAEMTMKRVRDIAYQPNFLANATKLEEIEKI